MESSTQLKLAASLFALFAAAAGANVAMATPPSGITQETFVPSADLREEINVNNDRVKLQTKGAATVRVQKLTFAAGATSGWHHHPGIAIATVASGSVTLRETTCGVSHTYGPGSPMGSVFVEGHNETHMATSAVGAVVYVTYIDPTSTFRVDDPSPCS